MKSLLIVLASLIAACSAHPPRIDCGAHLTPINTPAPARTPSKEREK